MIESSMRSTEGIDSLHIDIEINFYDVQRFCSDQKIKWEEGEKTEWQRKGKIFLSGGKPINVTYHSRSKRSTFEFGGFLNYNKDPNKLQLLRNLLHYFPDRSWLVSRLDYAIDANMRWDMFLPEMRGITPDFSESSVYFNKFSKSKDRKKLLTMTIYDKASEIGLFSTSLTRVELRLFRPELRRLNLMEMFNSEEILMKTANLIYSMLETHLKLHSIDGKFVYRIKTDVVATLQGFVAFLHSHMLDIHRPDPFRVHFGLELSERVVNWMKKEGITLHNVAKKTRGRKISLCREIGIDPKTFDKAISFLCQK